MLIKSLIGLAVLAVITIENMVLMRKKTAVVMILDQLFVSAVVYFIFNWITLIYSAILLILLLSIRYRRDEDGDIKSMDFSGRVFSVGAVFNRLHKPKNITIGKVLPTNKYELEHNLKYVELDDTVLSGATLITGSTGSGKTTSMKAIIKQRIDERKPVVFFDYKGEEDILDELQLYAEAANVAYYEFSSRKCTFTYDPFANLNETGKVEALMNTRRWSTDGADEHYKTSMQLVIQNLVRGYDKQRIETGEATNYLVGLYHYARTEYKPQMNERDGFNNIQKSIEILMTSKARELFGNDPTFSFETDEPFVICFSFTSANKVLANNLSSFTFMDIMDRGTRKHYKDKLLLCVDEFGTLESSTVIKDLLEKGRSGGVQTVFSILDVNQIAMNAGEHFVQAILGTINNYIIHAGATQKTAELLAGVQKFDKSFDIMSLRKPYRGKEPTALFVSKYPIFSKKGNQDVYRIVPYTKVLKVKIRENTIEAKPIEASGFDFDEIEVNNIIKADIENDNITIPEEYMPIDNIDDYL